MAHLAHTPLRLGAKTLLTVLVIGLSACTQFPELDAAQTPGIGQAPYPKLISLDGLLVGPEPRATVDVITNVQGRVAGLQARAARLRRVTAGPAGIEARLARLRQKAAALRAAQ